MYTIEKHFIMKCLILPMHYNSNTLYKAYLIIVIVNFYQSFNKTINH